MKSEREMSRGVWELYIPYQRRDKCTADLKRRVTEGRPLPDPDGGYTVKVRALCIPSETVAS
jgi:hypothetical protein